MEFYKIIEKEKGGTLFVCVSTYDRAKALADHAKTMGVVGGKILKTGRPQARTINKNRGEALATRTWNRGILNGSPPAKKELRKNKKKGLTEGVAAG